MALRNLNIGTRLGVGFGFTLVVSGVMLATALISASISRDAIQGALLSASARREAARSMDEQLLLSAVSVRNMGLQTTVEAVQKDEGEAKAHRAAYMDSWKKLESFGLPAEQHRPLERISELDGQMAVHFKTAVDLAANFNTEQAAKIITTKIDPLLNQIATELASFNQLQEKDSEVGVAAAKERARQFEQAVVGAAIVLMLISAALAWRMTVSITRPLKQAEAAAIRVSGGDLGFNIVVEGKDEAARMLGALSVMRTGLATIVSNVRRNAETVALASDEISLGNNDLATRTEQQASVLQQTVSTMDQLRSAVNLNADSAKQANQLAIGATEVAEAGGKVVSQVVETMQSINDSSNRITDIIGVIDGIAFQTNILALNAAVEAARAGEQGRGFAVVASEVRSLAQRSAAAAKEIKLLISASVEHVAAGSLLAGRAGSTMSDVVSANRRVTAIMAEISTASSEQSTGVAQISGAIADMDRHTQQTAGLVEQSAAAAESLSQQANELVGTVAVFKLSEEQ